MMSKYNFCPQCGWPLNVTLTGPAACVRCRWSHYDNPIPVAVVLASTLGDPDRKILMVRRGRMPCAGEWALPGGYIDRHEIPKVAACREVLEEAGVTVRLEKLLCACNPMPGEVNQIIISYLGRITEGVPAAGDDATEAMLFKMEDCPTPCFRSHRMLVKKWWDGRLGELTGKDLD